MPTGRQRMEALGFRWRQGDAYYPSASAVPHLHVRVPYSGGNSVYFVSYKESTRRNYRIYDPTAAWTGNAPTVIGRMSQTIQDTLTAFRAAYGI